MNLFKNKKGFTLVELIMVIAIMAVLAAVTIPSVKSTVDTQAHSSAKSTTQQVFRSMITITTEMRHDNIKTVNNNYLPTLCERVSKANNTGSVAIYYHGASATNVPTVIKSDYILITLSGMDLTIQYFVRENDSVATPYDDILYAHQIKED